MRTSHVADLLSVLGAGVVEGLARRCAAGVVGHGVGSRCRAGTGRAAVRESPGELGLCGAAVHAGANGFLEPLPGAAVEMRRLREQVRGLRFAAELIREDVSRVIVVAAIVATELPHVSSRSRPRFGALIQIRVCDRTLRACNYGVAVVGRVIIGTSTATPGVEGVLTDVRLRTVIGCLPLRLHAEHAEGLVQAGHEAIFAGGIYLLAP